MSKARNRSRGLTLVAVGLVFCLFAGLLAACEPLASAVDGASRLVSAPSASPTETPVPAEADASPPSPTAQAEPEATADLPTPSPTATPEPSPTDTPVPPTATLVPATLPSSASPTPAATPTPSPVPIGPIQSNPDGQFSVLLLGYGGPGHPGPYLTDSMMVVIANPAKKTLTLLSLARDSWVPLSFTGGKPNTYDKLNTAYAYAHDTRLYTGRVDRYKGTNGAGNMAKDTVSQILGIPIDYYLAIDFQGFKSAIDALGGVDLTVAESFTTRYPANDNPSVNSAWTIVRFVKGPQHMNGDRALQFARAREVLDNVSEANDFARASRQRLVLTAVKDRLLQPATLLHLPQLLSIATRSSVTDYPLPALANLVGFATSWNDVKIYQSALSLSNYLQVGTGPNGTYILIPRADNASWSAVRAFARRLYQDPNLGTALSQTDVQVVNRSGDGGLGSKVSDRLAALGYSVEPAKTGPIQAKSDVLDNSGGSAAAAIASLGPDLGLPALEVKSDSRSDPARIVVELGKDAVGVALADLPPDDGAAPTSSVGVVRTGSWVP